MARWGEKTAQHVPGVPLEHRGHTPPFDVPDEDPAVLVADGDRLAGAILLRDRIREGIHDAVAELQAMEIAYQVMLTGDRRRDLVKVVHKQAEEGRVSVRNIRRDHREKLERLEKAGDLSKDDARRHQDELQKLTDQHIKEIDALLAAKEKEISEV
jgi:cation transport ATPase